MPFVDQRWLGGMLTNFKTVKTSIKRLKDMEAAQESGGTETHEQEGSADVPARDGQAREGHRRHPGHGRLPDAIFVIDVGYHKIAMTEAKKLGIPVIGVVDTNHSPEGIDYVIPGNDDSAKAVDAVRARRGRRDPRRQANAANEVVQAASQRRRRRIRRSQRRGVKPEPARAGNKRGLCERPLFLSRDRSTAEL